MKKITQIFILLFLFGSLNAQLQNGTIAPDFTVTDIEGNQHNLYDVLAEGKSVILDFSATWCGPCWSYHNSGALHDYMEQYGPEGTDESMVYYIESDITTTLADLNGNGSNTTGDWVTGTNYPIIDAAYVANMYQINAYPTIMMVCPDRKVKAIGTAQPNEILNQSSGCGSLAATPEMEFWANNYQGCNSLTVQFNDNSWPRPNEYNWDFGDGNTSTESDPVHTYESPGKYTVTLKGSNDFGQNTSVKEDFITIGDGDPYSTQVIGPEDNNVGTGRYFEGGHQALIFNATNDFVLESVKVFSNREQERTIVLWDNAGNLINSRTINIPEGEHRIDLDLFVPQGNDYQLGLYSDAYLYRNDGGAQYPYTIDDLVSITKSTASTAPTQYYYYFYDWNVREAGCFGISNVDNSDYGPTQVYPVPVNQYLTIRTINEITDAPKVYNSLGQPIRVASTNNEKTWQLDFRSLAFGVYYVEFDGKVYTVPKQ